MAEGEYSTENKRLSVIVPVYKVENYLEECVNSLLSQTYPDIEIILVDDGSPDKCPEICDAFSAKHSNIKVVHQENGGLPAARNAGIAASTGEYISFVDSDDFISKEMYSELIKRLEKDGSDMAICNFRLFNKKGTVALSERYQNDIITLESDIISYYECALDSCWNRVYKAPIIKKNGLLFEDKKIVAQEDFWFNFRYFCHTSKISAVKSAHYQYRQRASSITKQHFDNDITDRCIHFIDLAKGYVMSVGRNADCFLEKMTLNLMFSSINNLNFPTAKKIKEIVLKFKDTPYYKSALAKYKKESGIRGYYNSFINFALKHKFYFIFACLESIRVKRLNSGRSSDDYFA